MTSTGNCRSSSARSGLFLPAVTVLLALLLTVPLSAGLGAASNISRSAYFAAFLASAAAVVMLAGESAFHRLSG